MNRKPPKKTEEIKEESHYDNEPVSTVETMGAPPDHRFCFFTQHFPLISVCWLILLVITGLRIHFTSVISENNAKLETRNQELETQMNNMAEHIRDMETNWNELNVSRAQWSIDAYCPLKDYKRVCQHCQDGWEYIESSCYAIAHPLDQKTWEEAREDCRGVNADLIVIYNEFEKDIVTHYSWGRLRTRGHWIGLRVEDGKWKWINGSDLTEISWIETPTDGHCAISVTYRGWKSVRCDTRQLWICRKNAISYQ